jgi:Ca2+-binding EF-hand superfamily protein
MIQATDADHDGRISRSELSKLLDNIGAKDQLNAQEVQEIMDELGQMEEGEVEKQIHIDTLEDMILNPNDSNSTVMA